MTGFRNDKNSLEEIVSVANDRVLAVRSVLTRIRRVKMFCRQNEVGGCIEVEQNFGDFVNLQSSHDNALSV